MLGQTANPRALAAALLLGLSACPPAISELTSNTNSTSSTDTATDSSSGSTEPLVTTDTGSTTDVGSTTSQAVCGDGVVEGGEACDDGNSVNSDDCLETCELAECGDGVVHAGEEQCDDGNREDGDLCLNSCVKPTCGDGVIQKGLEQCDDGSDNAFGLYGGCTPFCLYGPRCGDSLLDPQESCDDGNDGDPSDGCLDGCVSAVSCLSIKEGLSRTETGLYQILPDIPDIEEAIEVWCDMDTDGGGYTFLKVDVQKQANSPAFSAVLAEEKCASYGLRLFVPRTQEHAETAYYLAVSKNVSPVGGGIIATDPGYMSILGIYPKVVGQSCIGAPFNSEDCAQWHASDDGPFWVSKAGINGQPSKSNCSGCSMYYEWFDDGKIANYFALKQGGFSSPRFLCAAGDKKGPN